MKNGLIYHGSNVEVSNPKILISGFASGIISREAFWVLAKFKHPINQIVFTTENALKTITYKNHYLL